MAGKGTVPVVLVGRYTTFAGETEFATIPINVVGYDKIEAHVWRGRMITGGECWFHLEGSLDQQTWSTISPTVDPGAESEDLLTVDLTLPWLRAVISPNATAGFPVATCYIVGLLVKRLAQRGR